MPSFINSKDHIVKIEDESPPKTETKSRRSNKPLMERKRRERINQCLHQLKLLVLKAQNKDPVRYSKLEKADILEMTVRHMQTMKSEPDNSSNGTDNKYRDGYTKCASEVTRYLSRLTNVPKDLQERLQNHLNHNISSTKRSSSVVSTGIAVIPTASQPNQNNIQCDMSRVSQNNSFNNNPSIQMNSNHIEVSTRLNHLQTIPTPIYNIHYSPESSIVPGSPSSPESARQSNYSPISSPDTSLSSISSEEEHSRIHNSQTYPLNLSRNIQPDNIHQIQNNSSYACEPTSSSNHKFRSNDSPISRRHNLIVSQTPMRYASSSGPQMRSLYLHPSPSTSGSHWRPW